LRYCSSEGQGGLRARRSGWASHALDLAFAADRDWSTVQRYYQQAIIKRLKNADAHV
jgi:hypothetical protein